ncbi:MAG: beta-Ala-His dipeptidase [Succinivibrio sp.]
MSISISELEPKSVFSIFSKILTIPRPSSHEEKIAEFILDFAKEHNLKAFKDETGNVIVEAEATAGKENTPTVILQGHIDMVTVAKDGLAHDFFKDPIDAYIEDGFIKAHDTTLGADNGIAVAMALALMTDPNLSHGPVRAIFTVEEETTMKGALNLDKKYLNADYLINLDSEDNGYLFVSCAGSTDINIKFLTERVSTEHTDALKIELSSFTGGHSGADIHLGHGNAIKVLASILDELSDDFDFFIQSIDGGVVRNSIPTSASVVLNLDSDEKEEFSAAFKQCFDVQKEIYKYTDKNATFTISDAVVSDAIGHAQSIDLLHLLHSLPSGISRMSPRFEGIVETSVNLGVIRTTKECISISMLPRSLSSDGLSDMIKTVKAQCYLLDNTEVETSNYHEPWSSPDRNSLIEVLNECYKGCTGQEFKITALHAGVECAAFAKANPDLQLISIGPTILNPHSIKERVDIRGTADIYKTVSSALAKL